MLILMNSSMCVCEGVWTRMNISKEMFKRIFEEESKVGFRSYIGYNNACRVLAELLGVTIPMSRDMTEVKEGDVVLVAKLKYRVNPKEKSLSGGALKHGASIDDYEFCLMDFKSLAK